MFTNFLISKKEISKFKVTQKNPLNLTCEKVTQTPRVFNTTQIKNAIENITLIDIEEKTGTRLLLKSTEYILKDLFLYMHQTGLYNRQFKLWKTLGNITHCSVFKLQKGFLKKKDTNLYMIDFFIDPKSPCLTALVNENKESNFNEFDTCISKALSGNFINRLKGIFYLLKDTPDEEFITKLKLITNAFDSISKYESTLSNKKDVRLNVITFKKNKEEYNFTHVYPELRLVKAEVT